MAFGSGLVMAMAMPPMAQCQREAYGLCERRAFRLMQQVGGLQWHRRDGGHGTPRLWRRVNGWRNGGSLSATQAWTDAPLTWMLEYTR